jgi:hypothetical protein
MRPIRKHTQTTKQRSQCPCLVTVYTQRPGPALQTGAADESPSRERAKCTRRNNRRKYSSRAVPESGYQPRTRGLLVLNRPRTWRVVMNRCKYRCPIHGARPGGKPGKITPQRVQTQCSAGFLQTKVTKAESPVKSRGGAVGI